MSARVASAGFDEALLAGAEEPVWRFFRQALADGAPLGGTRISMNGRIRVGPWLSFRAVETCDARSFRWDATARLGPVPLLRVCDRFADGEAVTEGRLPWGQRLFHSDDPNTVRSAATRAALESVVFAPGSVLPGSGVRWKAVGESELLAAFDLGVESPEVRVRIDAEGRLQSVDALRWTKGADGSFGYQRCGASLEERRSFGGLTVPTNMTVSWHFGEPEERSFFRAQITAVVPLRDR